MTRAEFIERWNARQVELERLGAQVDGGKLCREVLGDFEAVTSAQDEVLLSLEDAAQLSGYSKDHLRRLARDGKLWCDKRSRRLFFKTGLLPKKATVIDAPTPAAYDPVADARRVATLPKESNHG